VKGVAPEKNGKKRLFSRRAAYRAGGSGSPPRRAESVRARHGVSPDHPAIKIKAFLRLTADG